MPNPSRLLLDTHILVRLIAQPKLLSKEQARAIERAERQDQSVAVAAVSLLEIASLVGLRRLKLRIGVPELFGILEGDPRFEFRPVTFEIAAEVAAICNGTLHDPADLAIVATARVHGLQLVTSDQPIAASGLVRVID